jgi:hypothetical protein
MARTSTAPEHDTAEVAPAATPPPPPSGFSFADLRSSGLSGLATWLATEAGLNAGSAGRVRILVGDARYSTALDFYTAGSVNPPDHAIGQLRMFAAELAIGARALTTAAELIEAAPSRIVRTAGQHGRDVRRFD